MTKVTKFLTNIRHIAKLHDAMLKDICDEYNLTLIEANIISFLKNNPGKDTAADIVELRMLSKGNVSQAVEKLIQKSLIERKPDDMDRRKIHLVLLPAAEPIAEAAKDIKYKFIDEIFTGFSEDQRETFLELNDKIIDNIKSALERRK